MRKPILFALLAVAGVIAFGETAHARNRRACYGYSGWSAPTISAPMTTTTQDGAVVSQSTPQNNASTYQSNSFEPSSPAATNTTVIAPVVQYAAPQYSAPTLQRSNSYEYNHVLRGDKKARGIGM